MGDMDTMTDKTDPRLDALRKYFDKEDVRAGIVRVDTTSEAAALIIASALAAGEGGHSWWEDHQAWAVLAALREAAQ